ncbi:MAG: hypothetical protein ACTTKH_01510 [Treponema sp.]
MKKVISIFSLIFLFYLYAEDYLLLPTQDSFNSIRWTENSQVDFPTLPSPYSVPTPGIDSIYFYADTLKEDAIYPEVEGLGVLDYSNTPYPLLESLQTFSSSILQKKIINGSSVEERTFLPHLFAYRFENMKDIGRIDFVFFSPPTFKGAKKATSKFRFNYMRDGKRKHRMMEATFIQNDQKWLLESFDFLGWELDDTTN